MLFEGCDRPSVFGDRNGSGDGSSGNGDSVGASSAARYAAARFWPRANRFLVVRFCQTTGTTYRNRS